MDEQEEEVEESAGEYIVDWGEWLFSKHRIAKNLTLVFLFMFIIFTVFLMLDCFGKGTDACSLYIGDNLGAFLLWPIIFSVVGILSSIILYLLLKNTKMKYYPAVLSLIFMPGILFVLIFTDGTLNVKMIFVGIMVVTFFLILGLERWLERRRKWKRLRP